MKLRPASGYLPSTLYLEMRKRTRLLASKVCFYLAASVLVLTLLIQSAHVLGIQPARLTLLDEAGFGDAYVLHSSLRLLRTGHVYHDLTVPPYLPSIYSPLVFHLYAWPSQWFPDNPFMGPRLIVFSCFFLCVLVVVSITQRLFPVRLSWLWALALATSIRCMAPWLLQLRGDFPGALFGLLAIRLLMTRSPYGLPLAGLCAGIALQFKISFVAAPISGCLWLLGRTEWGRAFLFAFSASLSCVALYGFHAIREPFMLAQMLTLSTVVRDVQGCVKLILQASTQLVVLLALPGIPRFLINYKSNRFLLLLFAATSFAIASVTDLQAGGNINYFFESLLALVAIALVGCYQLLHWCRRQSGLSLFLAGIVLFSFAWPAAKQLSENREALKPSETSRLNTQLASFYKVFEGRHLFTTIPRLAILDPNPHLIEPFLLSYLSRLGKLHPQPLLESIRQEEFDAVLLSADEEDPITFRTIRRLEPSLFWETIPAHYRLHCTARSVRVYLPRNRPHDHDFLHQLQVVGCEP